MHKGIESWLSEPSEDKLADYIDAAKTTYLEKMAEHEWRESVDEGSAMIEALVALFVYHPYGYEKLVDQYEIIRSESEISIQPHDELVLNGRPDLIVKEKASGFYYTIDLKTAAMIDERALRQSRKDFQGILQPLLAGLSEDISVIGEIRWNLIKGKTTAIKDAEGKFQGYQSGSYLIRPYARFTEDTGDIVLSYGEYEVCTQPHPWKVKGGMCPGSKRHVRKDDWNRVDLWKFAHVGRIMEWVKLVCREIALDPNHPYQEDVLKLVHVTEPIIHDEIVRNDLIEQIVHEETRMVEGMKEFVANPSRATLNKHFPQNRSACEYPYKCTFDEICNGFEGAEDALIRNPNAANNFGFRDRTPNHVEDFGEDDG